VNISFNAFKKDKLYYVYHFGTVFGDNFSEFLDSLRNDKRVDYIEVDGRTFFVVEKRTAKEIPGSIRASFGMYNTIEDVDRLIFALKEISEKGFEYYNEKYFMDEKTGE